MCQTCFKWTIKTPEEHPWHRSGVFIVNFEHILHILFSVTIDECDQVNVSWNFLSGASVTQFKVNTLGFYLQNNITKSKNNGDGIYGDTDCK